jgi:hypothetical protein
LGLTAAIVGGWIIHLWLFSDAAWLHPELLGSSYYVWFHPETDTRWDQLRRVVDWKAFDPNVNRVRPLNDAFEVVDAVARPYLTELFGPRPSLLPSVLLTLALVPGLFFAWLRAVLKAWAPALLLTLVLAASPAFLSVIVASMHPAKRICMILLSAALYLAQRHADRRKGFTALLAVLLAAFLTDETGLAAYPVIAALYWRSIASDRRQLCAFLLLPLAFLSIVKWLLPAIYLHYSVHGGWSALADGKKLALFRYVLAPEFHVAAARQAARSILSTVGVSMHVPATEIATLVAVMAVTAWQLRSGKKQAAIALLTLLTASGYVTLLDWYPFPNEISYLGSFNYYYHSSVALLVIAWLAFTARDARGPTRLPLAVLAVVATFCNLVVFDRVNRLTAAIHLFPYSNADVLLALSAPNPVVKLPSDPGRETARFERTLRETFGDRWQQNGFYRTHQMVQRTPLMGEPQIKLLFRAFYPHLTVESVQAP